jgi:hypothetical protein
METILRFYEEDQRRKDALGRDEKGKLFTWLKIVRSGLEKEERSKAERDNEKKQNGLTRF